MNRFVRRAEQAEAEWEWRRDEEMLKEINRERGMRIRFSENDVKVLVKRYLAEDLRLVGRKVTGFTTGPSYDAYIEIELADLEDEPEDMPEDLPGDVDLSELDPLPSLLRKQAE